MPQACDHQACNWSGRATCGLQSLVLTSWVCTAATAALGCQHGVWLVRRAGRAQVTLTSRLVDVVLMAAMAVAPTVGSRAKATLVAMHLTRMAVANSTRPLLRSLLMDYVPKRHRGKVNALDSVRTLSWSGSAALGG